MIDIIIVIGITSATNLINAPFSLFIVGGGLEGNFPVLHAEIGTVVLSCITNLIFQKSLKIMQIKIESVTLRVSHFRVPSAIEKKSSNLRLSRVSE